MAQNTTSKWIQFESDSLTKSKITQRWSVVAKEGNLVLGIIKWFGRWRGYAFFPQTDTIFEKQCLRDIADFIDSENKEHRERRQKEKAEANG